MVIGDVNYDIMIPEKSGALDDLCDIFDLTNMVSNPTCFMKGFKPSLVDLYLQIEKPFVLRHLISTLVSVTVTI